MDIRKWLDETVLPEQPPSPGLDEQALPAPLLPAKPFNETRGREKHRRKRSTSDSSILDAHPARRQPSPIGRQADTVDSGDGSGCSDAHQPPSHSSRSSTSSHRYARRPRRRTRLERYEPGSKVAEERGTRGSRHRKDESKKPKRKSKRRRVDKPGVGLAQSFHAKNVAQDRLTLKPHGKLGLFNKGRVSSPVKGRGLPDLVFSEMKFLQKHKDAPEAVPLTGLPKNRKRKKEHAHPKQEEISAYFTSVPPVLAEKDVIIQAKGGISKQSLPRDVNRTRQASSVADRPVPTIEVPPNVSDPGFGSRGPVHTSTSSVSWSESIRAPSAAPRHMQAGSIISVAHLSRTHSDNGKRSVGAPDALHSHNPLSNSRRLTNGSGDRFHVSSSLPANHRPSRARSLPQRTCSPRPAGTNEHPEPRRTTDTAASPSSVPAVMPVHSDACRGVGPPAPTQHISEPTREMAPPEKHEILRRSSYLEGEESSGDPNTSSTLGRLLQQCNSALNEYRRDAASSQRANIGQANTHNMADTRHFANASSLGRIRSLPTVRFSGIETVLPPVPDYAGPGIYEHQEREQNWTGQAQDRDENILQEHYISEEEVDDVEEDDAFDVAHDDLEYQGVPQTDMALAFDVEAELEVIGQLYRGQDSRRPGPSGAGVAGRGFWRPNRLY